MTSDFIEHAARYAYEDAYPGKPWGMADTFTASMFKQKAAYYAPAFGKIISAAEAERDAALEHLATATYRTREYEDAMITEGERRATAAIVADLRDMEWEKPVPLEIATRLIADHIEQKFGKPAP